MSSFLLQVSHVSAYHEGKHHIGRLIATSNPSCEDLTAYLSPVLAFNLGIQHHLEAYVAQSCQQSNGDCILRFTPPKEEGSDAEDLLEVGKKGSQEWVQITYLSEPVSKEGFGVVRQPGELLNFHLHLY